MNPQHLLDQASHLLVRVPARVRQTDLRCVVSAAYYAIFHELIQDFARRVCPNDHVWPLVARSCDHVRLKTVANEFRKGHLPKIMSDAGVRFVVPAGLTEVARAIVALQDARHRADYDCRPENDFTPVEARTLASQARAAIENWQSVRSEPVAGLFLIHVFQVWKSR